MDKDVEITLLTDDEEQFIEGIDINGKLYPRGLDIKKLSKIGKSKESMNHPTTDVLYEKETLDDFITRVNEEESIDILSKINEGEIYKVKRSKYLLDSNEVLSTMLKTLRISGDIDDTYHVTLSRSKATKSFGGFNSKDGIRNTEKNVIMPIDFRELCYFEATFNNGSEKTDPNKEGLEFRRNKRIPKKIEGLISHKSLLKALGTRKDNLWRDNDFILADDSHGFNIHLSKLEKMLKLGQKDIVEKAILKGDNEKLEEIQNRTLDDGVTYLRATLDTFLKSRNDYEDDFALNWQLNIAHNKTR